MFCIYRDFLVEIPFQFEAIELNSDYMAVLSCTECGVFNSPPGSKMRKSMKTTFNLIFFQFMATFSRDINLHHV